ncbi:hypothetical protein BUALT_Bualt19G0019000 [Buddleja alternifolia]|uniref:Protein transport protein Sec61 subunit beta n=1 Tax=Buddleja alternifolia TaxID=168488 RepID=A0AAV6W6E7_9LAMI|nr:hypothetical protein BUALT_Bualt19G0019000 [Buddleja alternifolia]
MVGAEMATGGAAPQRGTAAAAAANLRRRKTTGGGAAGGAGGTMLQFYTDDAPGLKISPNVVLVMSIGFIAFVAILHVMDILLVNFGNNQTNDFASETCSRNDGAVQQQDKNSYHVLDSFSRDDIPKSIVFTHKRKLEDDSMPKCSESNVQKKGCWSFVVTAKDAIKENEPATHYNLEEDSTPPTDVDRGPGALHEENLQGFLHEEGSHAMNTSLRVLHGGLEQMITTSPSLHDDPTEMRDDAEMHDDEISTAGVGSVGESHKGMWGVVGWFLWFRV